MTSKNNNKPRLVRCPKCRNVLPEPPGIPVYECGGCGAILQAKKPKNNTVDITSKKPEDDSSGKRKMEQLSDDQEAGSSSNQQVLVNSIDEPVRNSGHSDLHSSTEYQDVAEKAVNGTAEAPSSEAEEYSSGKWKMKQPFDDQEASSSSNRQLLVHSNVESDRNVFHNDPRSSTELSGHEDPESSPEAVVHNRINQEQVQDQDQEMNHDQDQYQDAAKKQENVAIDAMSPGFQHSLEKQKMEQFSDDHEIGSSLTQHTLVKLIIEPDQKSDHDEPHNSYELSYHDDPESSPEATVHNRIDYDEEFKSCRNGTDFEDSSSYLNYRSFSEVEEPTHDSIANNRRLIRDSDGGSKSSFKSLIAEKLLDTRQKKVMHLDEDDILSEDESADLHHRRRFDRISSVETLENARFGGTGNYYGYEGSVSSFDGNDDQVTRKKHNGLKGDTHFDSGIRYRFNRHNEFHPSNGRVGKGEHRSTDVRSFYSLNDFHGYPRNLSSMIPENPKMERIELLKMVRDLQDQLERTNVSNTQQVPSYYNHVLNHSGRFGQRMAFSGEAPVTDRRRDASLCNHCRPQDRQYSAQLPRQHVCYSGPHYGQNSYYSPHFSGASTPKHHSESEFSALDDQWHRNEIKKRSPKKKIYVRPIAGGSPWITCYRCSELLQLPQSFLVFKKRFHSLRCGACSKVLKFTLSNGTHLGQYYPEETIAAPPSSEVEDYDKSIRSRTGPVSCSDRSFQKDYSTETDRNGSWEFSEDRKKATMSRDPSNSTRPSSSKISGSSKTRSEIEEVEPGINGSPLHWLMGYPSPSKVIRG
uniref:protein ENHANCED DISEASE RESISTANCE 4 n=1 Tax=Erigeron canadensis TaxID=72917 RepID=UPI001CB8EE99|nr:protein ENHANCED DISEASE RESISTANCE 4 [Erigeron canadensis]